MKTMIVAVSLIIVTMYMIGRLAAKRQHQKLLAELAALPPVKKDFSTPEGAILCVEDTYPRHDLEAAVACHDFETEARLYLRERGYNPKEQQEMLAGCAKAMEKTYRETMGRGQWPGGWEKSKSYFLKRESYDENIVAVSEITVGPDGSLFRQRILVSKTSKGWRVVKPLLQTSRGAMK